MNDLVAEYEAMMERGVTIFLEEKAYLQLIDFYEEEEQYDLALEVSAQAIRDYSYSVEFYLRQAEMLLFSSRDEEAIEILEQAAKLSPNSIEVILLTAQALAALGRYEDAFQLVEDAIPSAKKAEFASIHFTRALIFESRGDYEAMFYDLKISIELDPNYREALEKMWTCIHFQKRYDESLAIHEAALDQDPYSSMAWFNLGHTHAYLGNYEQALEAFEYASLTDETFETAYRERAELHFELQQYQKALECFQELLELFSADSDVYLRLGQCHLQLDSNVLARKYLRNALKLEPLQDEVLYHLGETYTAEGQWRTAIHFFEKAVRIDECREEYHATLAQAYYRIGELDKAMEHFAQATEIAPEEACYWQQYAVFLLETEQYDEALDVLDMAEDTAISAELLYCRIACLMVGGQRQEGLFLLGEALEEDYAAHPILFQLAPNLGKDREVVSLVSAYHQD
jgi:tetratricopeptide (TPR) repeat protein